MRHLKRKILLSVSVIVFIVLFLWKFLSFIYVPPILMYHSIDENESTTKLSLCPLGFEKQMKFLKEHHYNVISLEDMADLIKNKKHIPANTVSITFDDGFENNYKCAYPVLKKYSFPATIFVITNYVGAPGYLTWDQMKEMQKNGITLGSHTVSHQWLPHMDNDRLYSEINLSKKLMEKHLGREVKLISYPIGAHDQRVKQAVKDAGYKAACGTNPGPDSRWDDVYALKRLRISRTSNNLLVFWIESSGYYTFIKEIRDED